jgi:hypothetical protein
MYSLKQAILLSSQSQAYLDITADDYTTHYRLIAAHYNTAEQEVFTLRIYRVSYGDHGRIILATKPHKTIQKDHLSEIIDYLRDFEFNIDSSWFPVEEQEQ